MSLNTKAPLKVGVILLSNGVQMLDVAPADVLGMLEKRYLQAAQLPPPIVEKGLEIEWHFVTEAGEGMMPMTAGFRIAVTHSIATCPPLDILLLGGPIPTYSPSPAVCTFLQTQLSHVSAFITVCTGIIPALHAGILKGKTATGPKGLLPMLTAQSGGHVKFEEKRWVRDGKIWTSGGITNGLDCMAAFMKESFDPEAVGIVLEMADVGGRAQEYN